MIFFVFTSLTNSERMKNLLNLQPCLHEWDMFKKQLAFKSTSYVLLLFPDIKSPPSRLFSMQAFQILLQFKVWSATPWSTELLLYGEVE